jgi:hypothetical protein
MSHTMKLCEMIIEHHIRESYQCHRKPIWFYAREIDYRGNFFNKTTYGEM